MSDRFVKMNGLGNDFIVIEGGGAIPSAARVRALARRDGGIGCDQVVLLTPSERAEAAMRIWNADGGEVEACGNAARCVGWLVTEASGRGRATLAAGERVLEVWREGAAQVAVDLGPPALGWREIPLAEPMDTIALDLGADGAPLGPPGCVSMGNPHAVFFVEDVERAPVEAAGPKLERHPLFPERANIGFAQVLAADRLRLRVWERGVGETSACGTGAGAALVAAHRRGLAGRRASVEFATGPLQVEWRSDGHVTLSGPVAVEFAGRLPKNVEEVVV